MPIPEAVPSVAVVAGRPVEQPRKPRPGWLLPVGLIALGAIPVVAGTLRVIELLGGPELIPSRARFDSSPTPVILHIVSAIPYVVLGAFQFSARLRRRRPAWHRRTGRLVAPLGVVVALSALWMNQFYVRPEGPNHLLYLFRLGFGSAMVLSIVLGVLAVRRRDIRTHRAWMIRAYAIALGAGTQAFTLAIGQGVLGTAELTTALLHGVGWVINLAIAEWAIRRRPRG